MRGGVIIKRKIGTILILSENEREVFRSKICDFYAEQVEKKLQSLAQEQRLSVLDIVIEEHK